MEQHEDNISPEPSRDRRRLVFVGLLAAAVVAGFASSYYVSAPTPQKPEAPADTLAERPLVLPDTQGQPITSAAADPLPDPTDPAPSTTAALIEEADLVTRHLVESYPSDPDAYEMVGRLQLWFGSTARAAEAWNQALQLNPSYAHAYHGLGSVAAKKGELDRAVTMYRKALLLTPDSARTQIELAEQLISQGSTEEAVSLLKANVAQNPGSVEGLALLGSAYAQLQDHERAKESYLAVLAIRPDHADAQFGLATAFARLGLREDAAEQMAKFQQLRDGEMDVRRDQRNEYDDLDAMAEDIAKIYIEAGQIHVSHAAPAAAEKLWLRASKLHGAGLDSRQALAWLYLQQGKPQKTIEQLQSLLELQPKNASYPIEIARIYVGMNRTDEAAKTLQDLCDAVPDDPIGYVGLAEIYMTTGQKPEQALSLSLKAVELAPTAENYVRLSAAYERNDDWPAAVEAMRKAVDLVPDNVQYRQIYELLKKKISDESQP